MNGMQLQEKRHRPGTPTRSRARGRNRSCMPRDSKHDSSTACRRKRELSCADLARLASRSRDPIGYLSGTHLLQFLQSSPLVNVDPSGLISVCCRRMDHPSGRIIHHCQLRNRCRPGEKDSPVWPSDDPGRTMDDGTSCATATVADIEACLRRNRQSDQPHGAPPGINNNCQSNTVDRLAKCCLNSIWRPGVVAHPKGRTIGGIDVSLIFIPIKEWEDKTWQCKKPPEPFPSDSPTCPPVDDFSHHGWPVQPPGVEYPPTDDQEQW